MSDMIKTTAKRAPRKLAIPTRGGPSAAARHVGLKRLIGCSIRAPISLKS